MWEGKSSPERPRGNVFLSSYAWRAGQVKEMFDTIDQLRWPDIRPAAAGYSAIALRLEI
jgi:hypothetical protein